MDRHVTFRVDTPASGSAASSAAPSLSSKHVLGTGVWGLAAAILCAAIAPAFAGVAADIEALTGARTRIVWKYDFVQDGEHPDAAAMTDWWEIRGIDTRNGDNPAIIVPGRTGCLWPKITHDGNQVVYSSMERTANGDSAKAYCVDWSGANKRFLGYGYVLNLWYDKANDIEWVYSSNAYRRGTVLTRYRLDNPATREVVWNKEPFNFWVTISGDGKYCSMGTQGADNDNVGYAGLPNGTFQSCGIGCFSTIAPDASYRLFNYTGSTHVSITMRDSGCQNARQISVNPGGGGTWGITWSNDVRIVTNASPLQDGWHSDAQIYMMRFNASFVGIEGWVKVTDNGQLNCFATAWIDPGGGASESAPHHSAARRERSRSHSTLVVEAPNLQRSSHFGPRFDIRGRSLAATSPAAGCILTNGGTMR